MYVHVSFYYFHVLKYVAVTDTGYLGLPSCDTNREELPKEMPASAAQKHVMFYHVKVHYYDRYKRLLPR